MLTSIHCYAANKFSHLAGNVRKAAIACITSTFVLLAYPAHAATVDIADIPLYLGGQTKPNITYILDDSGSMHWELMPNEIIYNQARYIFPRASGIYGGSDYSNIVPTVDDSEPYNAMTRSPDINTLYYNPDTVYEPWTKADGSLYAAADPTAAYHNPENTGAGSRNLTTTNTQTATWVDCSSAGTCTSASSEKSFYPATYFEYNGVDEWDWNNYTKVEIKSANAPFTGSADRTDCAAAPVCTYDEEIQNFANWYQFYRSRILTARGGSGAAFAQLVEPTDPSVAARVNFGTLNKGNETIDGVATRTLVGGVRPFTGANRTAFFTELYQRDIPAAGTPLRRALDDAGQYYSRSDSSGPWSETPGTSGGDDISCRQNYTILTTDGYWSTGSSNDAGTNEAQANNDGTDGVTISSTSGETYQYTAESPFEDNVSDTLADVAMYYWKRDLRTDLDNDVPSNPADPAFWQHMVTYGVSLGVSGTISNPDDAFAAIGDDSVTFTWPDPFSGYAEKIDDLLHASVNGRGTFLSAKDPQEFANGLIAAINNLTARTSSASSIATNSTRLDANTFIYQAKYDSADWSGRLLAYKVNTNGSVGATQWDAATKIPSASGRNIYTHDGTNGTQFLWNDISLAQQTALGSQDVLNYLRGDQSNEIKNGGSYRNRNVLLGDIINSDPWFVGESNFGYGLLDGDEGDNYIDFISSQSYQDRTKALYVGANDGMLHAFNAVTGDELFSYVPGSIYDNLPLLSAPDYNHKYYVDGSPRAGAAYIDIGAGDEWRTVLVGSTGAGGRSVFALDVTYPSSFDTSDILWEFTDPELGYTIGQASIVRLANGEWGAVFGNGYNSDSQTARIFIVNIEDGSLIAEFDTEAGDATNPNGMATPLVADINNDRIADVIYAGDLHGNLWRFDINDPNTSKWGSAYKQGNTPAPLFTAIGPNSEVQPITAKPQARNHPDGGLMVYFGTGKYFENGDNLVPSSNIPVQSFYGIHDNDAEVERADLLEQEIFYEDEGTFTNPDTNEDHDWGIRLVTQHQVTTHSGWYMDLISPPPNDFGAQGERVVSTVLVWQDRIILTTLIPNEDPCSWGGSSWLMELDPVTGGRLTFSVFDLNKDGNFDSQEYVTVPDPEDPTKYITIPVSGIQPKEGIIDTPGVVCADKTCYKYGSGSSGDIEVISNKGTASSGRQSWQQLK